MSAPTHTAPAPYGDDELIPEPRPRRTSTQASVFTRMANTRHHGEAWSHPLIAAFATAGLGGLADIQDVLDPDSLPGYLAALTAVAAGSAAWTAHAHMRADPHVTIDSNLPRKAATYAATCATCAGSWITAAASRSISVMDNPTMLFWLFTGLLTLGPVYSTLRRNKRHTIDKRQAEIKANQAKSRVFAAEGDYTAILVASDHRMEGCQVLDAQSWEPISHPMGVTLFVELPEHGKIKQSELKGSEESIAFAARQRLRRHGIKVAGNAVTVEPDEDDSAFVQIHIRFRNPFVGSIAPVGMGEPASVNDGLTIGYYENGDPVVLPLVAEHTEIVGMTRSGKTNLLHAIFAQMSRCGDGEIWVGGVNKVMDLVGPWCKLWWDPQEQRIRRPIFDYIGGESWENCMMMLFDALAAIKRRTSIPKPRGTAQRTPSREMPLILVVIEEAASLMAIPDRMPAPWDPTGKERYSASELVARILEIGAGEGVHLMQLNQYGLYEALGSAGSKMKRNINNRILLRTKAEQDASSVLGSIGSRIKPGNIKDKKFYCTLGEEARLMPAKAAHVDPEKGLIDDFVRANYDLQSDLDQATVDGLHFYQDRWSGARMNSVRTYRDALGDPTAVETVGTATAVLERPPEHDQATGMFGNIPDLKASLDAALRAKGYDPDEIRHQDATRHDTDGNAPDQADNEPGAPDDEPADGDDDGFEAAVRATLEKLPVAEVHQPQRVDPQHPKIPAPLGALLAGLVDSDQDYISVGDAAHIVGMDPGTLAKILLAAPFGLASERKRTPDYGNEPKRVYKISELRARGSELRNQE